MHIYFRQMYPLLLTIDIWNTITPNMFYTKQNAHILRVGVPPQIDNRCIEYCYTREVSHIAECMGSLLYVRLMGCNGVAWIYG